jgi:hypothetical protein
MELELSMNGKLVMLRPDFTGDFREFISNLAFYPRMNPGA